MNLLVLNTGSSSIKFSLFNESYKNKIFSSKIERVKDYNSAIKEILSILIQKKINFDAIAHRVVHGGDLNKPTVLTKKVEKTIETYSKFAPLHNPPALRVINACKKIGKRQYVVFDTSFFSHLSEKVTTYPIPLDISKKFKIKKYGFHGLSHKYVSRGLRGKTITCHLGSGCSVSAILNGKPIDTSMGLTPLEGIMMGTRAGDLDPGLVLFLEKKGYNMNEILNFKSGLKGISGFSEFKDIKNNLKDKKVKLAYDIFVYKILKYIGAYIAVLGGLDNLVFTGAIGENVSLLRTDITKNLNFLKSKFKIHVIKTDEESEIAKEVYELL